MTPSTESQAITCRVRRAATPRTMLSRSSWAVCLYMYALVKNIPDDTVAGILVLFRLAGVDVGQKHHNRQAISSFAGIAASMCIEGVAKAFADKPKNLQHPILLAFALRWRDAAERRHGYRGVCVLHISRRRHGGRLYWMFPLRCSKCCCRHRTGSVGASEQDVGD